MTEQERRSRSTEAFFGRRRGKALRPRQAELLETHLPALEDRSDGPPPQNIADLFGHAPERVTLEIGFGGGEHLLHRARQDPEPVSSASSPSSTPWRSSCHRPSMPS
jgi:tRNA (guanine-N7-)-methyltransferase